MNSGPGCAVSNNPGVTSLIPARSHTFMEIDHEIISTAILLPFADSRRLVVSYRRNYNSLAAEQQTIKIKISSTYIYIYI